MRTRSVATEEVETAVAAGCKARAVPGPRLQACAAVECRGGEVGPRAQRGVVELNVVEEPCVCVRARARACGLVWARGLQRNQRAVSGVGIRSRQSNSLSHASECVMHIVEGTTWSGYGSHHYIHSLRTRTVFHWTMRCPLRPVEPAASRRGTLLAPAMNAAWPQRIA